MSIGSIGSVSQASLLQKTHTVKPSNDGDADDKSVTSAATSAQATPNTNDGDADEVLGTAQSRLSSPSQAALLQLQSGK